MVADPQIQLAERCFVDDLPGARLSASRLGGIIAKIEAGGTINRNALDYLTSKMLFALEALATGQLARNEFEALARKERDERLQLATVTAARAAAEAAARDAAHDAEMKAYFAARERDPAYRRRQESKALRQRFGLGFIQPEIYPRVMAILAQLIGGLRLEPEDVLWLQTDAVECWTDEVRTAWHLSEARALTSAWERGGDAWQAANASGHWRKADDPEAALLVTEKALARNPADPKLQSALKTTRGGAMRDLKRHQDAKLLAEQAHEANLRDYRPCTLLGAVLLEMGDLAAGHEWYTRAEMLGAPPDMIDGDIRSLIASLAPHDQTRVRQFLLSQDPKRFGWLLKKPGTGNTAKAKRTA